MKRHLPHAAPGRCPSATAFSLCCVCVASAAVGGLGCAAPPPPPARSADTPTLPAPPPATPRYLRVGLTADLDRCEISAPHFFFDVDAPRPQDGAELRELAECLSSEPYRDLQLLLIGRADHRGTPQYNDDLARRRAQRVAEVLATHGVEPQRLVVSSAGETEAIGHTDELASLGYDRRVDIVVMNPVSPGPPARPVHHRDARR